MARFAAMHSRDDPGYEAQEVSGKGKGLFATRPFESGDVILEESPLVCCQFSWNMACSYQACDHCMRPMESAEENARRLTASPALVLPYPECCPTNKGFHVNCPTCGVGYCSGACREAAWLQYHRIICHAEDHPLTKLDEAWKMIHYPPETASAMLMARSIAFIEQAASPQQAIASFKQFCDKTVNAEEELVHKLLGEQFAEQLEMLRDLLIKAVPSQHAGQFLTPEGFRSLLALIGTNGQGIGTSVFSVWVEKVSALEMSADEREAVDQLIDRIYSDMDYSVGIFLNCEGSGLYSTQHTANHSCEPNAEVAFPYGNSRLALTAISDIEAGDEICISYLEQCSDRSRHTRQKLLRENYLFNCCCAKCVADADEPDCTSDEESAVEE